MTSRSAARADGRRLAALFAVLVSVRAHAQSSDPVELLWHAPAGCPTADEVQARIRKLAGSSNASGAPLRAEATITRIAGGRLHLKLVVRSADSVGERDIEGRTCEDLAGAAAVNLVLLLRSDAPLPAAELGQQASPSSAADSARQNSASADQPSRAPEAARVSPQPRAAPESAPEARQAEGSSRSWRGLLQLPVAALEFGPLPAPSYGLALAGGVQLERWRLLAEAHAWLPQTLPMAERLEVGAQVDRIDAGVRTCRTFPLGRLELAPCLNVSLAHIWARGTGPHVAAHTAESTWVAVGAGGQARLELTAWLNLVAGVDAQFQTPRPVISIDGIGTVGQLGTVAVRIMLGGEWIL
jgi:hypothetical protein